MTTQLTLDLSRVIVVANCWGPVFHLQDEDHLTFCPDEQTGCFRTIDEAAAFARAHGREPEIPERTRQAWAHWSPEKIAEYQRR